MKGVKMIFRRNTITHRSWLHCGAAAAALTLVCPLAVQAQTASAVPETVTVTGTIIRGAGPTGSNLITVDRAAIESSGAVTVSQVLAEIPGLNNFGSAGQGGQNAADPGGASSPTIHSLGSSASNGTLILVDSHRLPYTGIQHNTIDPSAIPVIALQQVQVLPDGASSTYGSDAVAGVLNFITRKNYTGMEFTAQYGIADHYENFSAGALFGHDWSGGSAILAYEYVSKSQLANGVRSYQTARQDLRLGALANPAGFVASGVTIPAQPATFLATTPDNTHGTTGPFSAAVPYPSLGGNFQNFSCPIATERNTSGSTTTSYLYPYTATSGIVSQNVTPGNGVCDEVGYGTWLPSENRNTVFFSFKQELNSSISLSADFDYSTRFEAQILPRGGTGNNAGTLNGTTNVTVFGPGNLTPTGALATGAAAFSAGQVNPFYNVGSTGLSTTSIQVLYDPTALLAGQPKTLEKIGDTVAFANLGLDWDLGHDWLFSMGGTFGVDNDFDRTTNQFCTSCAFLALNGTTNAQGKQNTATSSAIADPQGLGTVLSETRTLTAANALDIWDPAGPTNKTSAAVIKQLASGFSETRATQGIQDFSTQIGGPLFDMPAGPVKVALGGEYLHTTDQQLQNNLSSAEGPSSVASQTVNLFYGRTVWAAFTEILVPLISPEMNVPLIQKLNLDMSGRIDQYTTYGGTKNPKIGFTWQMVDGLQARGSFGTSFTVPAFASGGAGQTGITSQSAVTSGGTPTLAIPFNDTTYNGGAGVAGTWLGTAAGCASAGSQVVDKNNNNVAAADPNAFACKINASNDPDLQYAAGGKPGLKPETGMTYSFGVDFDAGKFFNFLDGLTGEVTFYQAKYQNLITSIGLQTAQPALTYFGPAPTAANPKGGWLSTDPFIQSKLIYPLTTTLPTNIYTFFDGRQGNAYTLWQNGLDFGAHYVMDTDIGTWAAGLNGNEILRFTQRNVGQSQLIDLKNGKALGAGRFAGQELTWRATLDWDQNPYRLGFGFNFQSPYFQSITTFPFTLAGPNRPANSQKIGALFTVDMTASYTIPSGWYEGLTGSQVSLSISNLLDTDPPFQDNANGFGPGSQLGRLATLSIKKSF
jgi:iron complex outermembrane receptor protein